MKNEDFMNHLQILMRQAKSHQETIRWIENNIGKGLRLGTDVEDESGKVIFSMENTPDER